MAQIFDTSQGLLQKIDLNRLSADLAFQRRRAGFVLAACLNPRLVTRPPSRTGKGGIAVTLELRRPFPKNR